MVNNCLDPIDSHFEEKKKIKIKGKKKTTSKKLIVEALYSSREDLKTSLSLSPLPVSLNDMTRVKTITHVIISY